jgi:mannose-6-phosphate isomerase-like protein (cupin superfamily)
MAVLLEGGCRVCSPREGEPVARGTARVWRHFDRRHGAKAISMRVLEFAPGLSPGLRNGSCDDVLYVVGGDGTVFVDGAAKRISPETALYLRPDSAFTVDNPGPGTLIFISSRCPDPGPVEVFDGPCTSPIKGTPDSVAIVRVSERPEETAGDRSYRVLLDASVGCAQVTQFVGSIPPGRAPDHFHEYEEVLYVLSGAGRLWTGTASAPLSEGSCVFLPQRQVHCVENTGPSELRLLGIFYPAGSPAVRYAPA